MDTINRCWINVNRDCNLRCQWCYAKSSDYLHSNSMEISLARKLIELVGDLNIPHLTVLGGEPTCYEYLPLIISIGKIQKLKVGIVTNGVKLCDEDYLDNLIDAGLDSIGLSLKGVCREDFTTVTKCDEFNKVMKAIENISKTKISCKVSMVITRDNCYNFIDGIERALYYGANSFQLSICHDFNRLYGNTSNFNIEKDVFEVVNGVIKNYEKMNMITKGNFFIHQSLPLCLWPKEILNKMIERNQLVTSCQLLQKSGLVFDPFGNVLPCNAMMNVKVGTYGQEFNNKETFMSFWESDKIKEYYTCLRKLPDKKCVNCEFLRYCGGGCVSNWLNMSFSNMQMKMQEFIM